VEKVAYSAFYQTRLEYILRAIGIDTLIVGGIVTNGGVASTPARRASARHRDDDADGRLRRLPPEVHEATLISLGTVTHVMTCAEALARSEAAHEPARRLAAPASSSRPASTTG
jgi:ureidoacrylate peracid hydrolase